VEKFRKCRFADVGKSELGKNKNRMVAINVSIANLKIARLVQL